MHQRRKAANDVDDRYFEQEVLIQAHEEIAEAILRQKEILYGLLREWKDPV